MKEDIFYNNTTKFYSKRKQMHRSSKQNRTQTQKHKNKFASQQLLQNVNLSTFNKKLEGEKEVFKLPQCQKQKCQSTSGVRGSFANKYAIHSKIPLKEKTSDNQTNEQKKNVLSVINKYITIQELRKHEQNLQNELKKLEEVNECIKLEKSNHQWFSENKKTEPSDFMQIKFDRVEIQERFKDLWGNGNIDREVQKINEQISNLQDTMNRSVQPVHQQIKIFPHLINYLNKLFLMTNFLFSKISLTYQQTISQLQTSYDLCHELRSQLHSIHRTHSQLLQSSSSVSINQGQLHEQINKLRSVTQCYQKQNFQLRKQVNILEQVIEQMNVQVEKAQKRLEEKRKQCRIIEEERRKMGIYVRELESELKNEIGLKEEVRRLRQASDHQEQQIKKWKSRCFKQENSGHQ